MFKTTGKYRKMIIGMLLGVLSGCSVTPVEYPDPNDPWENVNRSIMKFNDNFDDSTFKPIARAYQWITPDVVDVGISHFFSNIGDVGVTVNSFLQGKPKQGVMDGGRLFINTSVGLLGIFDVASTLELPKHKEDFAQTLAVWGVPQGNYVVLPFYGPSSVRGIVGRVGDMALHPFTYTPLFANPAVGWGATGLRMLETIDIRADFLSVEAVASETALDRYTFFRSAYTQRRQYLINDGKVDMLMLEDEDLDESLYEGLE